MSENDPDVAIRRSSLFYGIVATVMTAASGFPLTILIHEAYADVNDSAGLGVPFAMANLAPLVGLIVGGLRYAVLINRENRNRRN